MLADLIRGKEIEMALNILKFSTKAASKPLEKLLLSAIANWENKNPEDSLEEASLYIKEISVNGGTMLKRLQTAPQGRAYRIRKRSNHVNLIIRFIITKSASKWDRKLIQLEIV